MISRVGVFGSVAAMATIVLLGYLYNAELKHSAKLSSDLETANTKIETLELNIKQNSLKLNQLNQKYNDTRTTFRQTKQRLDDYKAREATVKAKPVLVEKMINKSFAEFMTELQCDTGATESCKN